MASAQPSLAARSKGESVTGAKAGHGRRGPVHEDAELGVVEPRRQRSGPRVHRRRNVAASARAGRRAASLRWCRHGAGGDGGAGLALPGEVDAGRAGRAPRRRPRRRDGRPGAGRRRSRRGQGALGQALRRTCCWRRPGRSGDDVVLTLPDGSEHAGRRPRRARRPVRLARPRGAPRGAAGRRRVPDGDVHGDVRRGDAAVRLARPAGHLARPGRRPLADHRQPGRRGRRCTPTAPGTCAASAPPPCSRWPATAGPRTAGPPSRPGASAARSSCPRRGAACRPGPSPASSGTRASRRPSGTTTTTTWASTPRSSRAGTIAVGDGVQGRSGP